MIYVLFEWPDYPETKPVKNLGITLFQTTQMLGLHLPHLQSQLFQTFAYITHIEFQNTSMPAALHITHNSTNQCSDLNTNISYTVKSN